MKLIKPSWLLLLLCSFIRGGVDFWDNYIFRSSVLKGGERPGAVSRCSVSPPVTLRWPSRLFYIFINNQLSVLTLHSSQELFLPLSNMIHTSPRNSSEETRRFRPFASWGSSGDSAHWFLKFKTCGWLTSHVHSLFSAPFGTSCTHVSGLTRVSQRRRSYGRLAAGWSQTSPKRAWGRRYRWVSLGLSPTSISQLGSLRAVCQEIEGSTKKIVIRQ